MNLLFNIVYAAHANGTHHKLALDSLRHLTTADAGAWTRLILKHAEPFLQGSKAPDTEFKDFKNHVLHVRDGFWGGAPEKVQSWYGHLVDALRAGEWEPAVYSAGVLSHYVTDPIHPFHTGQSEAENNVHRAVEWSINRSYGRLRQIAERDFAGLAVTAPQGEFWLKDLMCENATISNRSYEKLMAHYDIRRGVVDPPAGLDSIAEAAVAELLMLAAQTFALVLDRAFAESGAAAPAVELTAATVLATLKVPLKFITKKLDDAATRRQVEAMYDELMSTGRVEANLPEDDRMVRDLHAAEVLAPAAAKQAAARRERLPGSAQKTARTSSTLAQNVLPPAAPAGTPPHQTLAQPQPSKALSGLDAARIARAPRVSATDPLQAATSIGPKLAARFAEFGVMTVGDFLSRDAQAMAAALDDARISGAVIAAWQDQARLVLTVPGLTGTQAQLIAGAGFTTRAALAAADPADLSAAVLLYAATSEGKRILRDGNTPDLEQIKAIVSSAALAQAA